MSAVVRMVPLPDSRPAPKQWQVFEQVVARSFSQRRKMLRRSLANWEIDWDAVGIKETARAESLSVADFIRLSDYLLDSGKINQA